MVKMAGMIFPTEYHSGILCTGGLIALSLTARLIDPSKIWHIAVAHESVIRATYISRLMIEYYKYLVTLSHPHPVPLPPRRARGHSFTQAGERLFPRPACEERARVRGMLTTGCLVDRKLSIEKMVLVAQVTDSLVMRHNQREHAGRFSNPAPIENTRDDKARL
jgi:hypothetical protein